MSANNNEDLIDYEEEEEEELGNGSALAGKNGASTTGAENGAVAAGEGDKSDKKGSYVGIHSTGFRDFLLKPELLRAVTDCGFEHPSEGQFYHYYCSAMLAS